MGFLCFGEFRLFPPEPAPGLRHRHSLVGPGANQVSFELGQHPEDVEQGLAHWIVRIVDAVTRIQRDTFAGELVGDVSGVRQRTG